MFKIKPLLLALTCALLQACATPAPPPKPVSIVPTVMCHEDDPAARLPALPDAPDDDAPAAALKSAISALYDWAAQAGGTFDGALALRSVTSKCLAQMRRDGRIN